MCFYEGGITKTRIGQKKLKKFKNHQLLFFLKIGKMEK